jgi:hypothetical protein
MTSAAKTFDVVVLGSTPGGIMSAVAAARGGCSVLLLERAKHLGGLPANGLGATDIGTRGVAAGLFKEFVDRIHAFYVARYGPDSAQVKDCGQGYYFEPSVAEQIFETMLTEQPGITVLRERQFDAVPANVLLSHNTLRQITVMDRNTGTHETYAATVFIDATYEGDLSAAAGVAFRTNREAGAEFGEPLAGKVYVRWLGPVGEGTTFAGDDALQAYNFRMCLTDDSSRQAPIEKPASYNRDEFASLVGDVTTGWLDSFLNWHDKAGVVNPVRLPNGKTDSNNHHLGFLSTDLPEENWPWPTADWKWRDAFAQRLRSYTLGLLWFCQNDPELPENFRAGARRWGLAKDEYQDNGNFPRQVYVREGRRITGEYCFTGIDAIPVDRTLWPDLSKPWRDHPLNRSLVPNARPPIHADSITASHYPIDSHAVHKRETGRCHLDGFLSHPTQPYMVPFGVIVPQKIDGLLAPVPVSATHIGYGTLRMEPCWMALGHAAGIAATLAVQHACPVRSIDREALQRTLIAQRAMLIYVADVTPDHPSYAAIQYFGVRGWFEDWKAEPNAPLDAATAAAWAKRAHVKIPESFIGRPRAEGLDYLLEHAGEKNRKNLHKPAAAAV